ncbi:hypothetical protein BDZ91DRAFT_734410 [Kalaharituber pfeilii]|nr:hypothetical protein BDZ91DRAFT_734410 [Kalaharituber pfeilii]
MDGGKKQRPGKNSGDTMAKKTTLVEEGKATSSVVVHLERPTEINKGRLGGRWLRACQK